MLENILSLQVEFQLANDNKKDNLQVGNVGEQEKLKLGYSLHNSCLVEPV